MLASPPPLVQQTQYRLAQHYLKKLQQIDAAMTQASSSHRAHWVGVAQQDWPQIKQWRDWSAADIQTERARLCVDFCVTASAATSTQQTTAETIVMLRQGLRAAQHLADLAAESEIRYMLGLNHLRLQQFGDTRACAEALMTCGETLPDDRVRGRAWYLLACVNHSSGNFDEAAAQYTRSQELLEAFGPKDMVAVWAGFGHVAYFQGNYQASREYHTRSMEQAIEVDDEPNVAVAHLSLAGVCLQLKDMDQALYHAQETLRIARKLSFLPLIPHSLTVLANVNRQLGHLDAARTYYEEVLGITRATLSPDSIASALNGLGRVYALQGDDEAAIRHFMDALAMAQANNIAFRIPTPAEELIRIHLAHGDLTQARARLVDLLASAQALKSVRFYARTIFAAAALWQAEGQAEQAAQWIGLLQPHTQHLDAGPLAELSDRLRSILGAEAYAHAVSAGASLTLEELTADLADLLGNDPGAIA